MSLKFHISDIDTGRWYDQPLHSNLIMLIKQTWWRSVINWCLSFCQVSAASIISAGLVIYFAW